MKQVILFLSMFLLLVTSVFSLAEESVTDEPVVVERWRAESGAIETQVIVLEDGTEEVHTIMPEAEGVHRFADERILAIEDEAREKIRTILDEIHGLADRSDEGDLQKKIGKIKLDAEIACRTIRMEDAWDAEDYDSANKMREEIDHLKNLDEPAVGVPGEQPAP